LRRFRDDVPVPGHASPPATPPLHLRSPLVDSAPASRPPATPPLHLRPPLVDSAPASRPPATPPLHLRSPLVDSAPASRPPATPPLHLRSRDLLVLGRDRRRLGLERQHEAEGRTLPLDGFDGDVTAVRTSDV